MTTLTGYDTALHWFWIGTFTLFGVFALFAGQLIGQIAPFFKRTKLDDWAKQRLLSAAKRRENIEGCRPGLRYGYATFSFAAAGAAAFGHASIPVSYALWCVGMIAVSCYTYLRVRNCAQKRMATLERRTPVSVLPRQWFVAAGLTAFVPLLDRSVAACAITVSSLLCMLLATQLSRMPAILPGDDLPVERFLDDRLRFIRSSLAINFAFGIVFIYFSQTYQIKTVLHASAALAVDIVWLANLLWILKRQSEAPSAAEIEAWRA